MMPGSFVLLENLPLTANGKINYQALPTASDSNKRNEAGYVGGRDEIERKLIKIWEELLGMKPIGVKDNFFDLGGHSLLATRLIARIEKTLGTVSLSNLFQSPTIESLARELRQKKKAKEDSALVLFRNGGSRPPLFLHGGSFELSRYLGEDQPCYGIRPHGQDGRRAPATVEEMAADYLKTNPWCATAGALSDRRLLVWRAGGLRNGPTIATIGTGSRAAGFDRPHPSALFGFGSSASQQWIQYHTQFRPKSSYDGLEAS